MALTRANLAWVKESTHLRGLPNCAYMGQIEVTWRGDVDDAHPEGFGCIGIT